MLFSREGAVGLSPVGRGRASPPSDCRLRRPIRAVVRVRVTGAVSFTPGLRRLRDAMVATTSDRRRRRHGRAIAT